MTYIHELPDWPRFYWKDEKLSGPLAALRHKQGRLIGRMESMGFALRDEAVLKTLTLDVMKSSEIEGETLNWQQVRSSVARRMGMNIGGLVPSDRSVDGVVEMMLDATQNYAEPLNQARLFQWHASLFPSGYSGMSRIRTGCWRDDAKGAMRVISGPVGHERVHFEAPAASRLEKEMAAFFDWFNHEDGTDLVLKAGVAHIRFVTIHPFEDGNGRIARALADMLLARSEERSQRFYSMSAQIRKEREAYYDMLEDAQKGTMDITEPLGWFLGCLSRAFDEVETILSGVMRKARFWEECARLPLNERQRLMLNKILDGFEGKLTSTKWAIITKCSQDTAARDINDLVAKNLLVKDAAGGRSTSYSLIEK